MRVIVASKNPVKINAALRGFEAMFPEHLFNVDGISAPSGVSDQPMTDAETLLGALNRATRVRERIPDADYWVGIEGGVHETDHGLAERAWIVIHAKDGRTGKGSSGTFFLPEPIARLIRSGAELADACDVIFEGSDCRQKNGAVGLLTGDVIHRTSLYEHAMALALIPFKNPSLYPHA